MPDACKIKFFLRKLNLSTVFNPRVPENSEIGVILLKDFKEEIDPINHGWH